MDVNSEFVFADAKDGGYRRLTNEEKGNLFETVKKEKVFRRLDLSSTGYGKTTDFPVEFKGETFYPTKGKGWKTNREGMDNLLRSNRIFKLGDRIYYKLYYDDSPLSQLSNLWNDTAGGFTEGKIYAVQTNPKVLERSIIMTTDPSDIILDPTCGSGTTAFVAEQWGRRWITCDTSRVAVTLAKQRLMTASFDYYELAHNEEGIGSGFKYRVVPHITLGSIANNEPPGQETLYDQPFVDTARLRVTGPFTVEAVPAPVVKPIVELPQEPASDQSIARSGETLRQSDWREELLRTGIRGKRGQYILFSRLEPLPGTRYLQATGEIRANDRGADRVNEPSIGGERVVISFGPDHAPLEQRQVALAIDEAQTLVPKPKVVVFAAFQFDPEAAKDIDEINWPGVTLLKAQMNPDLLTEDLKKARSSNESFWLIGQPDIRLIQIKKGDDKGKWQVSVEGFDYYNTKTGEIESGGAERIAIWMLDTDYDGRALFPRQVFFPMSGENDGWSRLAKTLRAEIEEDLIEAYRGIISLPFESGSYKRIAVKIVDDRGIESLKIMKVE
jgi:adenine-specific DNA-methyltransferase